MLVKTNQKDKNGKDLGIYTNVLTGQSGKLGEVGVAPSDRFARRNQSSLVNKVRTNRKSTNGRPRSVVGNKKHIRETNNALARKALMLTLFDRISINKSKWHKDHPEYQKKNR
jgi:hypothetical protein